MYTIIICPDCERPKLVEDDPETTTCGRCQSRLKFRELKHYYDTEDSDEAREVLGSITAQLRGKGDQYEELLENGIDSEAVSERIDAEFQSAHGVDDSTSDAGTDGAESRTRREIVRDAIESCDPATEDAIIDYATDHGVPRDKAAHLLASLHNEGDVLLTNGEYRAA